MKKVYHLANCTSCQDILKQTKLDKKGYQMQDIKTEKITPGQLEEMKKLAGTYEALFSRKAIKYRDLGLKYKKLDENDYRYYILEEYTFLKRPVVISGKDIYIGNDKKAVERLKKELR